MANLKNDPAVQELLAAAEQKGYARGLKTSAKAVKDAQKALVDGIPADAKALKKTLKEGHATVLEALKSLSA